MLEDDLALAEARRDAHDFGATLPERSIHHGTRYRRDDGGLPIAASDGKRRIPFDREGAPKEAPLPRQQANSGPRARALGDRQGPDVVSQGHSPPSDSGHGNRRRAPFAGCSRPLPAPVMCPYLRPPRHRVTASPLGSSFTTTGGAFRHRPKSCGPAFSSKYRHPSHLRSIVLSSRLDPTRGRAHPSAPEALSQTGEQGSPCPRGHRRRLAARAAAMAFAAPAPMPLRMAR